jgi:hypothetical protein
VQQERDLTILSPNSLFPHCLKIGARFSETVADPSWSYISLEAGNRAAMDHQRGRISEPTQLDMRPSSHFLHRKDRLQKQQILPMSLIYSDEDSTSSQSVDGEALLG